MNDAHERMLKLILMLEKIRLKDGITLVHCIRRYKFVSKTA